MASGWELSSGYGDSRSYGLWTGRQLWVGHRLVKNGQGSFYPITITDSFLGQISDCTLLGQLLPMPFLSTDKNTPLNQCIHLTLWFRACGKGTAVLAVKFRCLQSNFIPVAQTIQSPPRCCRFNSLIFYGLTMSIVTSPLWKPSEESCTTHHLALCAYVIIPTPRGILQGGQEGES